MSKYKFPPAVLAALAPFQTHLQQGNHDKDYIRRHKSYAGIFMEWIARKNLAAEQVTSAEVLEFAGQLKKDGHRIRQVNRMLLSVRYYFKWLGQAGHNPAAGIKLKGVGRRVPQGLYNFAPATLTALEPFKSYLQQEHYSTDYVRQNSNYTGIFLEWTEKESLAVGQITHADVLEFTDRLRQKNHSIRLINQMMRSLRYYFSYLQQERKISHNPAAGIILKGTIINLPHDLLTKTEMESLYESYQVTDNRTYRNKVILGLLVYQGIARDELIHLRPEHLKLREGKIQIPATGRQLGRVLALQPHQILELHEYLLVIRPKILAGRMDERGGKKPDRYKAPEEVHRLFITMTGQETIKSSLLHMNFALRKINPKYLHGMQIRQSVITEWLKEKNLRTVQYMAGHRYVSSTERYKTTNLEDLKEALNKHHPLTLS
jgi:integrase/recombinase XerD